MPASEHTAAHPTPSRRTRRRRARIAAALIAPAALMAAVTGATAAPVLQITDAGAGMTGLSTADEVARTLLAPDVPLAGPASINGSPDPAVHAPALPSFGRFTDGAADIGIDDGLIIGANTAPSSFLTTPGAVGLSHTDPDLFAVVDDAGLCDPGGSAADCVHSATGLEFTVRPTSRYIKFEYALGVTESGSFVPPASWSGAVHSYPDGFALFVGGRTVAHNCAVVPGTDTYLTMKTAGIVPLTGSVPDMRAVAQANLAARLEDPAAPAGFAYRTDSGWSVQFLTVPLTCVADVGEAAQAGEAIEIKIVVANIGDTVAAPALFLRGGSVRFADDSTAAVTAPAAPDAPVATGGDGAATVNWSAPADGGAAITGYTVTAQPGGRTCSVASPATSCTVTGLTNGTTYTFAVAATNAVGTGPASAPSAPLTPAAPAPPSGGPAPSPAPAPPAGPAPAPPAGPAPAPPAGPAPAPAIATPLTPPAVRPAPARAAATRVVNRIRLNRTGRYTVTYIDRATGRRIAWLPGSRIGRRTLARRASAPVIVTRRSGTALVLNSLLARRAMPRDRSRVALRIVLRQADGTLSEMVVGADGTPVTR